MTLRSRILQALDEMEGRCVKATPGPWAYDTYGATAFVFAGAKEEAVCDLDYSADVDSDAETVLRESVRAHAAFIAAARTDLPRAVTALRSEVERHWPDSEHGGRCNLCGGYKCSSLPSIARALGVEEGE